MNIMALIRSLLKQGYTTAAADDSLPLPVVKFKTTGKDTKGIILSVYGVCSNPPTKSHVFSFNAQGQESNKFAIINDFLNRKKNLAEGEVALFNSLTGAFVLMKEDGTIEIESDSDVNLTAPNLNVTGNITCTGKIDSVGDISSEGDCFAVAAGAKISLKDHFSLGNLGYNTGVPIPVGGAGVPAPASPPKMAGVNLDINGNDIVNVNGVSATVGTHTHPVTTAPGTTGAPS